MRYKLKLLALLFVLCCAFAPQGHAAKFSGIYLTQLCEKDENGREKIRGGHAACQSYISGVLDYHSVLQSLKIAPKLDICVPDGATLNELHDAVLQYLKKNGQHDGFVAAPAVTMALYQHYPCRRRKK